MMLVYVIRSRRDRLQKVSEDEIKADISGGKPTFLTCQLFHIEAFKTRCLFLTCMLVSLNYSTHAASQVRKRGLPPPILSTSLSAAHYFVLQFCTRDVIKGQE
jgi:hypothetical protein